VGAPVWVAAGPGLTVPSAKGTWTDAHRCAVARAKVFGRAELYRLVDGRLVFAVHVDGSGGMSC